MTKPDVEAALADVSDKEQVYVWPTRPSDLKEFLYFFSLLGPYLAFAWAIILTAFLVRKIIGDTALGVTAVAANLVALLVAYLRYPAFLLRKSVTCPRIHFDGRVLKFTVKSGIVREMVIAEGTQIELAYYSLRPTEMAGAQRGLWLEVQNKTERVVFTGQSDFKLSPGQNLATKPAPYTPFSQRVATFSQVLVELYEALHLARTAQKIRAVI
jgi:hypothetical protein